MSLCAGLAAALRFLAQGRSERAGESHVWNTKHSGRETEQFCLSEESDGLGLPLKIWLLGEIKTQTRSSPGVQTYATYEFWGNLVRGINTNTGPMSVVLPSHLEELNRS